MAIDIKLTYSNETLSNIPSEMQNSPYAVINNGKAVYFTGPSEVYDLNDLSVGERIGHLGFVSLDRMCLRNGIFYYSTGDNTLEEFNLESKLTKEYTLENAKVGSQYDWSLFNNKYIGQYTINDSAKPIAYIYKENGSNVLKYDYGKLYIGSMMSLNPFITYRYDASDIGVEPKYIIYNENDEQIGEFGLSNGGSELGQNLYSFGIGNYFYFVYLGMNPLTSSAYIRVLKYDLSNVTNPFNPIEQGSYQAPTDLVAKLIRAENPFIFLANNENICMGGDGISLTLSVADTPDTFKGTINFADGDSVTQDLDREVHYVETHYLVGTCTFNFYDKENKIILSTAHDNPDSYKYAETITINGNQYPINTKQQITLNSDFSIQVNNGVVAYYYVAFNNDTKILQQERLQENTLPVYKGETPTKAGYEFIGWEPTIYPVDKEQEYQAQFSVESSSIITFKKKDGTTKTYNAIKFIKKDGTSKTYTSVKFVKKGT